MNTVVPIPETIIFLLLGGFLLLDVYVPKFSQFFEKYHKITVPVFFIVFFFGSFIIHYIFL